MKTIQFCSVCKSLIKNFQCSNARCTSNSKKVPQQEVQHVLKISEEMSKGIIPAFKDVELVALHRDSLVLLAKKLKVPSTGSKKELIEGIIQATASCVA